MVKKATAASMIESYSAPRKTNVIQQWESVNKTDSKQFWEFMRDGYWGKSIPFTHCIKIFREHFPTFPEANAQTLKRIVDERLSNE